MTVVSVGGFVILFLMGMVDFAQRFCRSIRRVVELLGYTEPNF
jgi:hypothetical protein